MSSSPFFLNEGGLFEQSGTLLGKSKRKRSWGNEWRRESEEVQKKSDKVFTTL
jgi:hypothetical protein